MSARVSVIVPAYNRADMIGETLECLLGQTLPPCELFVVDDGSTDNTAAVVRGFGDRVTLIEQANAGPGAARNAGLARATGEFVQFFDSDDLCTRDKLEAQAGALEATGADIAYGPWIQARLEDGKAEFDGFAYQQGPIKGSALEALLCGWLMFIPTCVVRRSLLLQLGGFPTRVRTTEDLELLVRALLAGARMVHVPEALVVVRQHPEGQISAASAGADARRRDLAHYFDVVDELLASAQVPLSFGARAAWNLSGWNARHQAGLTPDRLTMRALLRARQIRAGVRRRLTGTRMPGSFAPAPLRPNQVAEIQALGYVPTVI